MCTFSHSYLNLSGLDIKSLGNFYLISKCIKCAVKFQLHYPKCCFLQKLCKISALKNVKFENI